MKQTKIEWTETTWNPSTGCTKISEGCKNCYAERMATRLQSMGLPKYAKGFNLNLHPASLKEPYKWKKHRLVFVNSMSDLFHENMPLEFIKAVFQTMNNCPQHTFQILTKRADILAAYSKELIWTKNIWMGVTVESNKYIQRIDLLKKTDAHTKFVSMEPLLTSIPAVNFNGINWVIVGGESGPGSRPIKKEWIKSVKEICKEQDVHFFFKQWGGINKKKAGRTLDGKTYNAMPTHI